MKKLLILLLISLVFISGCKSSFNTQQPSSSTISTTIVNDVANCQPEFLRRQVNPDGSVREYCLPADYFKLKPCSTNKDCSSAEYCDSKGYCQGLE